jgi:coenzyme F420-dependent glucose-6-phosphate dehydrogenase
MAQFGWKAGAEQYTPQELLDYAIAAEAAGFDSLDVSDHFHPWAEKGQAAFVWTWLGAVAARTSTIKLGPGVTCPILRYHPSIVAQACATLACLAPGRVYLGVGTGEALNEYSSVGQWPEYTVRQAQLGEAIELMRALWRGEPVTHEGEFYQTHQAKIYSLPRDNIPIYVSSLVPESAYFAGLHGDGLFTVGGEEPELYREMIKNFEAGAKKAGRGAARLPKIIEVAADFTKDKPKAIAARKEYWAGAMVPAMFTQRLHTPKLSEANGKVVGSETIEKATCISDEPADHVEHARQYLELGFDHLYFHSAGPDQGRFIEAYGQLVLPQLKSTRSRKSSSRKQRNRA